MVDVSINPKAIINSGLFKFICFYILVSQISASQSKEDSIYKNIFLQIAIFALVFYILEYDILSSIGMAILFSTVVFLVNEK